MAQPNTQQCSPARRVSAVSLWLLAAAFITFGGCSKSPTAEDPVAESGTSSHFEDGSPEHILRGLFEELTIIASAQSRDPRAAVQQVRRFIDANEAELQEATTEFELSYTSLEPSERPLYAEQVSNYLQDVTVQWQETMDSIRATDESAAARIEAMLPAIFD